MKFNRIDCQNWNRKDTYNHFFNNTPCTYSMTVNLNITNLMEQIRKNDLKVFPTILYGITHTVNSFAEFRMDIDCDGNVGFYDFTNPCYTVFHTETETFTNVWTEFDIDFKKYLNNYDFDMERYQDDYEKSKPVQSSNNFNVSCIPWTSFTGFNLNLQKGYDYFPPIFTIGKYFEDSDKIMLPLAIQVHHAVCDGFHTARFVGQLQKWADTFAL